MLLQLKAVYRCDVCGGEEEWLMGNEHVSATGTYGILDQIFEELKLGLMPGWIRDQMMKHWCPKCHMKK